MLEVVREVVADVMVRSTSKLVVAKQNDAGSRFLNVRIKDNGKSLNIPSTSSIILNVQRPDKSAGTFYGTVNEDGTVKVELNSWILEQAGTVSCDISIIKEDSAKLTTMTFYVDVEAAVVSDEDIIETDDYIILVDLINKTQDACDQATEAERIASAAAESATEVKEQCEAATEEALEAVAAAKKFADDAKYGTLESEVALLTVSKQNVLVWVTDDAIDAMFEGTYVGEEKENEDIFVTTADAEEVRY